MQPVGLDSISLICLAQDIDPATLALCRVEPTFAGSDYPFAS